MHRFGLTIPLLLLASWGGSSARGATIDLTITDATLVPGGTAVVDVLISSPDDAMLDLFGLEVRVEAASGQRLQFLSPPPDEQLTDPDYLFSGDSAAALFPPAGAVVSTIHPDDTYIGGDGTLSGLGVEVPDSPTLLARLELIPAPFGGPTMDLAFTVSVVADSANTFFLDRTFNPIDVGTLSSGTVTAIGFIPEPTALVLTSGGLALIGLARLTLRRRRA